MEHFEKHFKVDEGIFYRRLDKFLRHVLPELKLSSIYKLLRKGNVRVNGKRIKEPSHELSLGDIVVVSYRGNVEYLKRLKESRELIPHNLPIKILYEDESFLAVDKPSGLAVHPGKGVQIVTLIEGLLAYGKRNGFKPFLVHRLDKHTSGVLLVAKSPQAARELTAMFREKRIDKRYVTLVKGIPEKPQAHLKDVIDGVREESEYIVKKTYSKCSLLEIRLFTGKKHQIRRQMAKNGHPVVGDDVYGDRDFNRDFKKRYELKRYFLHCMKMGFIHPKTGHYIEVLSELPDDLKKVLEKLS